MVRIPHPRALVVDLILLYVSAQFKITLKLASYLEKQVNFFKVNINKIAFMPQIFRFSKS